MEDVKRQSPTGLAIFCDEVRVENTGKVLIIGGYFGGEVIFHTPAFPVLVPMFTIFVNVYVDRAEADRPITIHGYMPWDVEGEPTINLKPSSPPQISDSVKAAMDEDDQIYIGFTLPIRLSPFEVRGPGRLRVYAIRDDKRYRLGSIMLKHVPPPSDPSQPTA